jgi:4'-phosphopantetheinyl transferase
MRQPLVLTAEQVHIWLIDPVAVTDPGLLERYAQLLTPDEHAKWQRYRFDKDKHQHLVTRALIRTTLSRYEPRVTPADWRFELNAHGKPAIANPLDQPLHFNLSHTQNLAALAVTREAAVGVDVEKIKPVDHVRGLAERCFADEEIGYVFDGDQNALLQRFFKVWTLKEAYLKARGCGMSLSLHSVIFTPQAQPLVVRFDPDHDDPSAWSFYHWAVGADHQLSLALNRPVDQPVDIEIFTAIPLSDRISAPANHVLS